MVNTTDIFHSIADQHSLGDDGYGSIRLGFAIVVTFVATVIILLVILIYVQVPFAAIFVPRSGLDDRPRLLLQ